MRNVFVEQGRTKIYAETYFRYVAGRNLRRTPLSGKMALSGWALSAGHLYPYPLTVGPNLTGTAKW